MIVIRGRFASYAEVWFDEEPPPDSRVDVLISRLRPNRAAAGRCTPFLSLVSDLTVEAEAFMAAFGGTNRYKIKRADSKDGVTAEFVPEPLALLDEFCAFYDAFAEQKTLPKAYRRSLDAACAAGQLVLSAASHAGQRIVWHAYIRGGGSAALLHSASHFRQDGVDRALVGRANRWLHWQDMLGFKALGLARYDWGGMFEDESVPEQASINNFKREFGGRPCCAYNCVTPLTMKGKAFLAARSALELVSPGAAD
jgi:hypothetical protein